jgi:serine/threonine protein kinase
MSKIEKYDDMILIEKLGSRGKDAQVYSCQKTTRSKIMALKMFRKNKNEEGIESEFNFLKKAYRLNLAPKPIAYSLTKKYITMEMIGKNTLFHYIQKNHKMTTRQQKDMIEILEILDKNDLFHGDVSPSNFMIDNTGRMYIIDFGMSKKIDDKFKLKNGDNSNIKLGIVFFILKIREIFPDFEPKHLITKVKSLLDLKK